ncbi:hypothetical protein DMO24_09310 [Modestobacter versicolor]|uniref:Uncharacterized protein n=1 Tax=Modestobacter versicolor TaxID=429133 RepID=A0A323V9W4_9ACTN|nr:hypothetical protein DMO24_09310 [Modestobacter versicolor]
MPVLRDLRRTGAPLPARLEDSDWDQSTDSATAMLWSAGGSGVGIRVFRDASLVDQVVDVTDQVQEWAVEELAVSGRTDWPPCPKHPGTHPLRAERHDGAAWWACPRDGTPVAEVGTVG